MDNRKWKMTTYNCMGYALDIKEWLLPRGFVGLGQKMTKKNFNKVVENLKKDYSLEQITEEQAKNYKGKIIAFRNEKGGIEDFHFAVKKGNNWYHKRGGTPVIERMKKREVFSDIWCGRYRGHLAFFKVAE